MEILVELIGHRIQTWEFFKCQPKHVSRTTVAIENVRRKGFLWTGGVKQDNTGVEVPLGEKTMWAEEPCT